MVDVDDDVLAVIYAYNVPYYSMHDVIFLAPKPCTNIGVFY